MRKFTPIILIAVLLAAIPTYAQEQPATEQTEPIALAPELFLVGVDAFDAQDYDTALLDLSLFLLLNPTFSEGYYLRALSHLQLEDTDSALTDIQQAIDLMPDNPQYGAALYGLRAEIFSSLERYDDAIADYTEAIDLNPSAELYFSRARLYGVTNDLDEALNDMDSAVAAAPDDPVLRVYRAIINTEMGDAEAAAPDYYRFMQLIETERVEHAPLVDSEPQFIRVDQGVIHEFELEGERDQVVTIVAQGRPGDNIDPLLVLLDEDGEVLAANDDYNQQVDSLILDFQLPSTGTYLVLVSHSLGGYQGEVAVAYQVTK